MKRFDADLDFMAPADATFRLGTLSSASDGPTISRASVESAFHELASAWNLAAATWNVEALVELYADNAVFFGGRPSISVGTQEIRQYFASYTGVLQSVAFRLVEQRVITIAPGTLLAQGFGRFHFVLAGGVPSDAVLRTTLSIVKHDTAWRIIQHHFSSIPEAPPISQ